MDLAHRLAHGLIETIRDRFEPVCGEARLSEVDCNLLWRRQFLNSFCFEGAPEELEKLIAA
jgi:serine/threonine-protein kinase HipA